MKPNAKALALRRLAAREYSAEEMSAYLRSKGVAPGDTKALVDELVRDRLIDDLRYAAAVAREQARRGKGPDHIQATLQQKGVNLDPLEARELFEQASDLSEQELAVSLLKRRHPRAGESLKERRRAFQTLLSRGFSDEVARASFKSLGIPPTDSE